MNPKHYLTTILIFSTILLFCFSAKGQNSSDTIRIEKRGLGYIYHKDNTMLNFNDVMRLTTSNPEAFRIFEKSNSMRSASYVFGFVGGGCLGYSLGYALGRAVSGNTINKPLFVSTLGVGAALIVLGIVFEVEAKNKAKEGINLYNNAIKQKNNANIDLGGPIKIIINL